MAWPRQLSTVSPNSASMTEAEVDRRVPLKVLAVAPLIRVPDGRVGREVSPILVRPRHVVEQHAHVQRFAEAAGPRHKIDVGAMTEYVGGPQRLVDVGHAAPTQVAIVGLADGKVRGRAGAED
jgi:hypothetical protein